MLLAFFENPSYLLVIVNQLVILNPGQKTASAEFAFQVPYARLTLLAGKAPDIVREGEKIAVKINGRSYAIYRLER